MRKEDLFHGNMLESNGPDAKFSAVTLVISNKAKSKDNQADFNFFFLYSTAQARGGIRQTALLFE